MRVRNFLARLRRNVLALRCATASVRIVLISKSANDASPGLMSEKEQKRKASHQRPPRGVDEGSSCLCFLPIQFSFSLCALPKQAVCLAEGDVDSRYFTLWGNVNCAMLRGRQSKFAQPDWRPDNLHSFSFRNRSALVMTETELKVIAALAIIGLSNSSVNG